MFFIRTVYDGSNRPRQDITVTRGDSFTLTVELTRKGAKYKLEDDDTIRVAISDGHKGNFNYRLVYSAPIDKETLTFTIPGDATKRLKYKPYDYDVEVTHGNGDPDTVLSGRIFLTGESE